MVNRPSVLVIDDDEAIRTLVDMALSQEGFTVLTATNYARALELLRDHEPRLILLDTGPGELVGQTFIEAYRQSPGPHVPVLVFSAGWNLADHAARIGADGFLSKPFELEALFEVVQRYSGAQ